MANTTSNIAAFLAGILFCPPHANTMVRLVAGPDLIRFNHLFDTATDMLMEICRDTRLKICGEQAEMMALPAETLADLMMGLALQMSLIASHLADHQGWQTDDFEEILTRSGELSQPLKSVFSSDLCFWKCLLRHRRAPEFLDAFEIFDELSRIRCVAALTSSQEPAEDIERFVDALDKKAFVTSRLLQASSDARSGNISDAPRLKKAIAWSIAASADHPTIASM